MHFLLLVLLVLVGCGKSPSDTAPSKPLVLVSLAPYKSLVERIGGEVLEVRAVVPFKANPHSFEPTFRQVTEIAKGEVWFRIGEPFESKLVAALEEKNPSLTTCDLREQIPLLPEQGLDCHHCSMDHLDRHIWLSPKSVLLQAEVMARVLSKKFPEHKELFQKNFGQLRNALTQLDEEIDVLLRPVQERILLVSHPAFGYFCRDYHFEQLSVEYEGKDPRPKHLEEILTQAKVRHAEFALALPQYNNKGAQLIAEKLHLPVRWIDPYSADYFETMRALAQLIANSSQPS